MTSPTGIKIGIDVGGTFTHAVAVDTASQQLLGKVRIPTTHRAELGVAAGVVQALQELLQVTGLNPGQIQLIAHSTTQATNALLEGDVATVGIIALSRRLLGWVTQAQTRVRDVELSPGQFLPTCHGWLSTDEGVDWLALERLVATLRAQGAQVFAVSGAFAVDDPSAEQQVVAWLRAQGYLATAGCELSQLYGLGLRTRTAVINAAILPRMLATANCTEQAVRASGITAPVMIMRSDGGIMSIEEMRQRPILTILSGPAAGVAAALGYARISEGLFLDVGGTSTDVSVILHGRPQVKTAEVAGKRLYLKALDVRTLGIAGGSVPRLKGNRVVDVGPRSAHIANLQYISFTETAADPADWQRQLLTAQHYLAVAEGGQPAWTFTPTDAAMVLGLWGQQTLTEAGKRRVHWLAESLGLTPTALAERVLALASRKVQRLLERLMAEYELERRTVVLVGGGGGAGALVPYVAQKMGLQYWLAPDAEVIAAIGVALGLIQETIERSIVNPTPGDVRQLRQEVLQAVMRMGAHPATITVRVEVDQRQQKITAIGTGALELQSRRELAPLTPAQRLARAAQSFGCPTEQVMPVAELGDYGIYQRQASPWWRPPYPAVRVVHREGVVVLQLRRAVVVPATVGQWGQILDPLLQTHKTYGDGGELYPAVWVLLPERILDFSGLVTPAQILTLANLELESYGEETELILLLDVKR
ncbi:MAG: hydantoinase/oxoprolinase family protein [Gloeomargarita sp. DG_1_6_bins_138]